MSESIDPMTHPTGPDFAGVLRGLVEHESTCYTVHRASGDCDCDKDERVAEILSMLADAWDGGWAARAQTKSGVYSLVHLDQPYRKAADALATQAQP